MLLRGLCTIRLQPADDGCRVGAGGGITTEVNGADMVFHQHGPDGVSQACGQFWFPDVVQHHGRCE